MALASMIAANALPAAAQTYSYGSPGVASVSVANGNVVIIRGDSRAQVPATINAVMVPGDYVATGPGSFAEVQFDGISMLRLAGNAQVRLINLNPGSREAQLATGTIDLAELQGADGSPQIDTPELSVRPDQTGDYRITVLGNGETLVTVRSGAATIASANGSQTLTPGSTLVAYGSSINLQNAIGFDSFDQFNISRDQAMQTAYNANPYISPQLAGYGNLANYGRWQNVPGYGYAWAPYNQSQNNFAPYSNGQWVWEPGYGYTWVDNSPYGYTTSHYGTWFNNPNYGGWLWQPPAYQYQNTSSSLASAWLPAVVSFFLSGSNGSSLGGLGGLLGGLTGFLGNSNNAEIGWIPLAPGEQYQPWYGQNYYYPPVGVSSPTNVTNVYNYYTNARYYGGAMMIPVSAWRSGTFTRRVVLRPEQVKRIVLIRGSVPVVPTTANLHYKSVAVVTHPIVLSHAFAAPRLAAKARNVAHISFKTQQTRIRMIAGARPKVVSLPPRQAPAAHPVYHAVKHAPIHVTTIKPVVRHVAPAPKPATHHAAPAPKPATHHAAPAPKPAPKPAVRHAAPAPKPAAKPAPKSAVHHAAPVPKPAVKPAPVPKPAVRPAPVPKPAVRPAPVPKPAVKPAPVRKPAAKPAPHSSAKSEPHPKQTALPGRG
ncbi:MAG TPA: DUF6600 domain-containing protein [Candidatus Baltobacteraceae bacterium]|nr:DUF6600 domain-containing protein [Candidatus Baltobacteraceae bacterium]